jgi:hypothetical protein
MPNVGSSWTYSHGREGVLIANKFVSGGRCLVFGTTFPWWGLVCGKLGLTLSKIVLCKYSLSRLVKAYFPNVYVRVTEEKEATRVPEDEIDGVRMICLERASLDMKRIMGLIQRGRHLESIVISRSKLAYKWKPPKN